jgi:hypothetical protein
MSKDSIALINGHEYKYRWNKESQQMDYLGPVGSSPALSREEFLRLVSSKEGWVNLGKESGWCGRIHSTKEVAEKCNIVLKKKDRKVYHTSDPSVIYDADKKVFYLRSGAKKREVSGKDPKVKEKEPGKVRELPISREGFVKATIEAETAIERRQEEQKFLRGIISSQHKSGMVKVARYLNIDTYKKDREELKDLIHEEINKGQLSTEQLKVILEIESISTTQQNALKDIALGNTDVLTNKTATVLEKRGLLKITGEKAGKVTVELTDEGKILGLPPEIGETLPEETKLPKEKKPPKKEPKKPVPPVKRKPAPKMKPRPKPKLLPKASVTPGYKLTSRRKAITYEAQNEMREDLLNTGKLTQVKERGESILVDDVENPTLGVFASMGRLENAFEQLSKELEVQENVEAVPVREDGKVVQLTYTTQKGVTSIVRLEQVEFIHELLGDNVEILMSNKNNDKPIVFRNVDWNVPVMLTPLVEGEE